VAGPDLASATYVAVVLPGLLLTSIGIGRALPTASIAITSGVRSQDQGLQASDGTPGVSLAESQLRKC
jgi:hypothetical protein